jgi:hypothetical protein
MDKWMSEWNPQDDRQRFLVRRAVDASWRTDRGVASEQAMTTEKLNEFVKGDAVRQAKAVARLTARIDDDPGVILELRRFPAGARWIRDQYVILERHLDSNSALLGSQRRMAIQLTGKRVDDFFAGDPVVTPWLVAVLGASFGAGGMDEKLIDSNLLPFKPERMSRTEFDRRVAFLLGMLPDKKQGKVLRLSYLAEARAAIEAQLELVECLYERDMAIAHQKSRVHQTPEGKRILDYEMKSQASLYAASKRLDIVQKPPRPAPRPGKGQASRPGESAVAPAAPALPPGEGGRRPGEGRRDAPAQANGTPEPEAAPGPEPAANTNEPIPELQATVPDEHGGRTTEDLPVFAPTDEELERDEPEFARLRKLHAEMQSRYGTGTANHPSEPGPPSAPTVCANGSDSGADPGFCTNEAILDPAPPADPAAPRGGQGAAGRAVRTKERTIRRRSPALWAPSPRGRKAAATTLSHVELRSFAYCVSVARVDSALEPSRRLGTPENSVVRRLEMILNPERGSRILRRRVLRR